MQLLKKWQNDPILGYRMVWNDDTYIPSNLANYHVYVYVSHPGEKNSTSKSLEQKAELLMVAELDWRLAKIIVNVFMFTFVAFKSFFNFWSRDKRFLFSWVNIDGKYSG